MEQYHGISTVGQKTQRPTDCFWNHPYWRNSNQQWIVWHPCDAKGGWWCKLNLEQTTEERLTRRLKKKPVIFGKYATKREAIRATCGSITLNNVWRGGQFAACSQLSHARGGVFCVGEFVKAAGSGFVCKE
jgi:hypothetical protein